MTDLEHELAEPQKHCDVSGCPATALRGGTRCFQHAAKDDLYYAVARFRAGEPLDARNTTISPELLATLRDALTDSDQEPSPAEATLSTLALMSITTPYGDEAQRDAYTALAANHKLPFAAVFFSGATFTGDADFGGLTFPARADFRNAVFEGTANFRYATFNGRTDFRGAVFHCEANLSRTTFNNRGAEFSRAIFHEDTDFVESSINYGVNYNHTTFEGAAEFTDTYFGGEVSFNDATISDDAVFLKVLFSAEAYFGRTAFSSGAHFHDTIFHDTAQFIDVAFSGDTYFEGVTFNEGAEFAGTTFGRHIDFSGADFRGDAGFGSATFDRARRLGPLVVDGRLVLDDCFFGDRINIEVAAIVMSARAAIFASGASLRVRWAEIAMDGADFGRASTLSGATTWRLESDLGPVCIADSRHITLEPRPRLITIRGAHVTALSLSDVDLSACRFFGAHGLESLSIETNCRWPHTPPRSGHLDRETIAEEHHRRGMSWHDGATQAPQWLASRDGNEALHFAQIAALYRALRKSREEDKDEAGASDLYYGEMEMRRHHAATTRVRRGRVRALSDLAVLTLYWAGSGYGLKASRSLVTLALIIAITSVGLRFYGFKTDPTYTRALLYSIESTSGLFRMPNASGLEISYAGEFIQIVLRLLGPLLIGLSLLALRARVKR